MLKMLRRPYVLWGGELLVTCSSMGSAQRQPTDLFALGLKAPLL
jgi:hypothetical protein